MEDILRLLLQELVLPLILAAAVSIGGWILSKLPGPVREFLQSATHKRDIDLLLGALARRAAVVANGDTKTALPVEDVTGYVKANLPELVRKLSPSDEALRTMALEALTRAKGDTALMARTAEAVKEALR